MVINGAKWHVPESWADVTLQRYIQASTALRDNEQHPRKAMGAAISAIVGFNEAVLLSSSVEDFEELCGILDFFFTTAPQPKAVIEFEAGGLMFVVPDDIQDRTFGEFVDMDSAVIANKDSIMAAVPQILAIYCRPEGEKYDPKLTKARSEIMGGLPIETAEGLAAFFLTSSQLHRATSAQFGRAAVSLTSRERTLRDSIKRTAGMRRLLRWPTMMFCWWMQSRISQLLKS